MLLIEIITHQFVIAQELYVFKHNDKYGYMDSAGVVVIESKFDQAEQFTEGFGVVYLNNKAGVINEHGKFILQPKYETINPFKNGVATFVKNKKYGLLDTNVKIILKPKYQRISFQSQGIIGLQQDELWSFYSLNQKKVLNNQTYLSIGAFNEGLAMVQDKETGKYGFINLTGDLSIPLVFNLVYSNFSCGFSAVCDSNKLNCYINKQGENTFKKNFDGTNRFYEGRAFVRETYNSDGYFIDTTGNRITQNNYQSAWFYSEGLCGVQKDGIFLVIDKNENILFSSTTIELRFFADGFGHFCDHSSDKLTWGIMNKQFQIVNPMRFTQFLNDRSTSRLEFYFGDPNQWYGYGKRGYLNLNGNIIWEEKTMDNSK